MRYRVLQPIYVPPGVALTLDAAQARARAPWLRSLGSAGRFESTGMLCFKAGEVLGIAGDTPRAFAGRVQPVDQAAQAAQAAQAPQAPQAPQASHAANDQAAHRPQLAGLGQPAARPAQPAQPAQAPAPIAPSATRARRLRQAGA